MAKSTEEKRVSFSECFEETLPKWAFDSPCPSRLKPVYQSETWCTAILMKMSLIYKWMKPFLYEMIGTKSRFENEAKGNLEMGFSVQL